jgi:hypothetical protein
MLIRPFFRSLTIAETFFDFAKVSLSRKREFSGVAKIPAIVSDRKKGRMSIKRVGSAQTQDHP